MPDSPHFDFTHAPTVAHAAFSRAFVTGIRGPVGSGKSVGGVAFITARALSQAPDANGWRRTRFAVIRNTTPELKTTTIKTWLEWMPEIPGIASMVYSSPPTYRWHDAERRIDCEVMFIALDKPKDVAKLLSLELTAAWVNEAREVPVVLIDALTGRVGRYPPGNATYAQIFLDTNSPDTDHWWYERFEVDDPARTVMLEDGSILDVSWRQYAQPEAVVEVQKRGDIYVSIDHQDAGIEYDERSIVEAAQRAWGVNPKAENLPNLRGGYYHQQIGRKRLGYIRTYLQNRYEYYADGKAATPSYVAELSGGEWPVLKGVPLILGIDAGGGTLQPAAIVMQRHPRGVWMVQGELVADSMGIDRFADNLNSYVRTTFPNLEVEVAWADPAIEYSKDEVFETRVKDVFLAAGLPVAGAPTQDTATRLEAIEAPCGRLIDGRPGLLVNKHRAPMVHKGLAGAWYFRQIQASGETRYESKPIKNQYSHPCEALGYALCGGGEAMAPRRKRSEQARRAGHGGQAVAAVDFDPYA